MYHNLTFKFLLNRLLIASIVTGIASQAFAGTWVNVSSNLQVANLNKVAAVPTMDKVVAGIHCAGVWETADAGGSWTKLGGAAAANMTNIPTDIIFDPLDPNTFWEVGIYGGANCSGWGPGVFKTTDGGTSFVALGGLAHNDAVDIDFSDPQRLTLVATGHEEDTTIYKSSNGGVSFVNIGSNFPGGTAFTTGVHVINSQSYVVTAAGLWGGGTQGIYLTTDGGTTWKQVSGIATEGPIGRSSWGAMYVSKQNYGDVIKGSADGTTWTELGCPVLGGPPVELPGGKLGTVGANGILISADQGTTWKTVAGPLPVTNATGLAYNSVGGSFYLCDGGVGVWRYDTMLQAGLNIYALRTNPVTITNNISNAVTFSVHAANSAGSITSVTIDLSSVGGGSAVAMANSTGDLYSCTFTVAAGLAVGTKTLTATVTDNTGKTASVAGALVVTLPSGPLHYLSLYTDTSKIQAGFGWVSNGNGTTQGVTGTEISTGAYEETNCLDFQFTVSNWWAGFGLAWSNQSVIVNATGYDSIDYYYKANTNCNFTFVLVYPNSVTSTAATMTFSGTGAWARASIPLSFYTSAGYKLDSIVGINIGITGSSATTPSGDLYLDDIYLVGSGAVGVLPGNKQNHTVSKSLISASMLNKIAVYDMSGKKVAVQPNSRGNCAIDGKVYLVKLSDGTMRLMLQSR